MQHFIQDDVKKIYKFIPVKIFTIDAQIKTIKLIMINTILVTGNCFQDTNSAGPKVIKARIAEQM